MTASPSTIADRYVHLRIFTSTIMAFGLIAHYANTYSLEPTSWRDALRLLVGPFLTSLLLLILANGRDHLWTNIPAVRILLGDESTTENRRRAQAFGFWAMSLVGAGVYIASPLLQIPPAKAVHLVVTLTISLAALRFGYLEQRSLSIG
jgi:hypothetical protein